MREMANATVQNYNKKIKSENYVKSKLEMNLRKKKSRESDDDDEDGAPAGPAMTHYVPIKDVLHGHHDD